jgi:hypothetical protein
MSDMTSVPTLVVVSGPMGAGKTTLAHKIAQAIGCPAICRDEIKEGMVHATPGFDGAAPGDELTMRTLPVFFGVVDTTDGYRPGLGEIVDFVNAPAAGLRGRTQG